MSEDVTKIFNLGPASVTIGGTEVGHTDKTGVKVTIKGKFVDAFASKYGEQAAVKKWIAGTKMEVEFSLIQTTFANLPAFIAEASYVSSAPGVTEKVQFGRTSGTPVSGVSLALVSFITSNTPAFDFHANNAFPVSTPEIVYTGDKEQAWKCKFDIGIDEASGADGSWLGTFGNAAAVSNVVAPTVVSVTPAEGAVGVSDSLAAVTWTFSKAMMPGSFNTQNVELWKDPTGGGGGTGYRVAGTVSVASNGLSVTFAPSGALGAAQKYVAMLGNGILAADGNALAPYASDFTTT